MTIIKKSTNNKFQMWRKGSPPTLLWECKLVRTLWQTVWEIFKKIKIELAYDPAIPFLGIYLDKSIIQRDTCAPMFIAALFTIAKTCKQIRCPSTDERIKKIWYIYTMEYYSVIKRTKQCHCSNMDATRDYHTEWSESEREREIPDDITYCRV